MKPLANTESVIICPLQITNPLATTVPNINLSSLSYSICLCTACTNIEKSKLKIIVHSGETLAYRIGQLSRLSGVDVITAHRLLKNSVDADEYILMIESARADVEFPEKLETVEGEEVSDVGTIKTHTYFTETSTTEYTKAILNVD